MLTSSETPIKILDCRVNPQWNSLPTYSSFNPSSTAVLTGLCSIHGTKHKAATATGPGSNLSAAATAGSHISRPGSAVNLSGHPSATGLADMNGLPLPPGFTAGIASAPGSSSGLHALAQANGSATPVHVRRREEGEDTLLGRNIVYDRLMSGQETEEGDIPPSYEAAAQATAAEGMGGGVGSASASRRGSAVALADGEGRGRRDDSPHATPRGRPSLLRGDSEDDGAVIMGSTSSSRSRERRGMSGMSPADGEARGRSKSRLRSEVV